MLDNKLDIDILDVLDDMDRILVDRVFTLEEIKVVVFDTKHNKAPGPDDLPIVLSEILTCYRS